MSREFPKNPELKSSAQYKDEVDAAWASKKVAPPTVGRVVHIFSGSVLGQTKDTPMAAIVTGLRDGLTIDACVFSGNGVPQPTQGIVHVSEPRHLTDFYWDWMDYQKGQAAKTEELERQLKQASKLGGE